MGLKEAKGAWGKKITILQGSDRNGERTYLFCNFAYHFVYYIIKNIHWQTLPPPSSPLTHKVVWWPFLPCEMAKECQILKHIQQHSSPNQVPQQTLVDSKKAQVCMFFFGGGGGGEVGGLA